MAKSASSADLKEAINEHLDVTRQQVVRLEQVFEALSAKAQGKSCAGMKRLIGEGQEQMEFGRYR